MVDFESPTDLLNWLDSLFKDETRPSYVIYDRACKVCIKGNINIFWTCFFYIFYVCDNRTIAFGLVNA